LGVRIAKPATRKIIIEKKKRRRGRGRGKGGRKRRRRRRTRRRRRIRRTTTTSVYPTREFSRVSCGTLPPPRPPPNTAALNAFEIRSKTASLEGWLDRHM
jgi:hypothetical protein